MNNVTLNKIWSFLGLASLILALNAVLATQGADFVINFGIELQEQGRYAVSVYGMMLSVPVFILFLLVTHTFLYKNRNKRWFEKFPSAFNAQFEKPSLDYKIYQFFFFFIFLVMTLMSQTHLLKRFVSGTAYMVKNENFERISPVPITDSKISHFVNSQWGLFGERYKYACDVDTFANTCIGGMTYFPVVQAWFSSFLVLICYVLVLDLFIALRFNRHGLGAVYKRLVPKLC